MFPDPTTWTWFLSGSSYFVFWLFFSFVFLGGVLFVFSAIFLLFTCFCVECITNHLQHQHQHKSDVSKRSIVAASRHTRPSPPSDWANGICSRMEFLCKWVSFCLILPLFGSEERAKIFHVLYSVTNDLSWMECHTVWDHYHSNKKDRIAQHWRWQKFHNLRCLFVVECVEFWRAISCSRFHKYWPAVSAVRQLTFP